MPANSFIDTNLWVYLYAKNPPEKYNQVRRLVTDQKEHFMSVKSYSIELPDSAFSALRKPPAEFIQEMKYAAVIKWYEAGMISQAKAAEIAGLSRYAFLTLLARYEASAIQYTSEVLEEELQYARGQNRP